MNFINMATQPEKPFLNFLFSQPRTCSHLLTRILNLPAQPTVHVHPGNGYFFMDILGARFNSSIKVCIDCIPVVALQPQG
jgi:hypothetical protein